MSEKASARKKWQQSSMPVKAVTGGCGCLVLGFVLLLIAGLIMGALGIKGSSGSSSSSAAKSPSATSSSPTSAQRTQSTSSSPSTTESSPGTSHSTQSSTASKPSTSGLPLGPKGNFPVAGPMPAPDNNVIGGYECSTQDAVLTSDGKLTLQGVKPVTMWTVEFDDASGNQIGNSSSGTVGEGDPDSLSAQASTTSGLKYAQVSASGSTTTSCTVIVTK